MIKATYILAAIAISLFGFTWYLEYTEYQNDKAFVEMCETMGGVAVLGQRHTNQCLNTSSVLGAE